MRMRDRVNMRDLLAPRMMLALLAVGGVLFSIYVANDASRQYRTLEGLRMAETVDSHFGRISEHILARENLARAVSKFFIPPPLSEPHPLGNFGSRALSLAPDITAVGWLPKVEAARAEETLQSLAASGVKHPAFRGPDSQPIDPATLDRPLFPIIDIAPDENRLALGVDDGAFPDRLRAILRAEETRQVTRTQPLRLMQSAGSDALLLYAPIFGESDGFLGVMGFGFKVDEFFRRALASAKAPAETRISIFTHGLDAPLFVAGPGNHPSEQPKRPTLFERKMEFGGGELRFVYAMPRDLAREGFLHALWVAAAGLLMTFGAVLLVGFMSSRAAALTEEVSSRRSAEERLKVLIHELNHRVRNVMAVAQAVVRLSFTPGLSLGEIQRTCEGRLQALAKAMSLLTASDWKGVSLRSLISEDSIPFASRIEIDGPDIALRGRSAQTFALLFYELATNAAKHGALSVPKGKVRLEWRIDKLGSDPVFHLRWRESGGPPVAAPARRGFGELLVRRIAPRDVAGRSEVRYAAEGFEYELEAPLRELIDAPRDRSPDGSAP